jgi:hypothetical protein
MPNCTDAQLTQNWRNCRKQSSARGPICASAPVASVPTILVGLTHWTDATDRLHRHRRAGDRPPPAAAGEVEHRPDGGRARLPIRPDADAEPHRGHTGAVGSRPGRRHRQRGHCRGGRGGQGERPAARGRGIPAGLPRCRPHARRQGTGRGRANGISKRTLERAKGRLRVVSEKDAFRDGWTWRLPR